MATHWHSNPSSVSASARRINGLSTATIISCWNPVAAAWGQYQCRDTAKKPIRGLITDKSPPIGEAKLNAAHLNLKTCEYDVASNHDQFIRHSASWTILCTFMNYSVRHCSLLEVTSEVVTGILVSLIDLPLAVSRVPPLPRYSTQNLRRWHFWRIFGYHFTLEEASDVLPSNSAEKGNIVVPIKFGESRSNRSWVMLPAHFVSNKQTNEQRSTELTTLNETLRYL